MRCVSQGPEAVGRLMGRCVGQKEAYLQQFQIFIAQKFETKKGSVGGGKQSTGSAEAFVRALPFGDFTAQVQLHLR